MEISFLFALWTVFFYNLRFKSTCRPSPCGDIKAKLDGVNRLKMLHIKQGAVSNWPKLNADFACFHRNSRSPFLLIINHHINFLPGFSEL